MKDTVISAAEFKAKCLCLLDQVAAGGAPIIITKRGKPVARLTPVNGTPRPLRDSWKGKVRVNGDIVNFNLANEWGANRK